MYQHFHSVNSDLFHDFISDNKELKSQHTVTAISIIVKTDSAGKLLSLHSSFLKISSN